MVLICICTVVENAIRIFGIWTVCEVICLVAAGSKINRASVIFAAKNLGMNPSYERTGEIIWISSEYMNASSAEKVFTINLICAITSGRHMWAVNRNSSVIVAIKHLKERRRSIGIRRFTRMTSHSNAHTVKRDFDSNIISMYVNSDRFLFYVRISNNNLPKIYILDSYSNAHWRKALSVYSLRVSLFG